MDGTCPEGLSESPYYDFYAAFGWMTGPEIEIIMISEGNACDASMTTIDFGLYDLEECARAVVDAGYQFFHQDPNDGECLWVETENESCPEGLYESPYYDFYSAYCNGECHDGPGFTEEWATSGEYFTFTNDPVFDWWTGAFMCEEHGGHLATIRDEV